MHHAQSRRTKRYEGAGMREVQGKKSVRGAISVPGDKSVSHRAVILSGLSRGTSTIRGLSRARDVQTTVEAMDRLGVQIQSDGNKTVIQGIGMEGFKDLGNGRIDIDCGNSGTTARLLMGMLAGARVKAVLRGDESLSVRPMNRVVSPLTLAGAMISSNDGRLPVEIAGGKIQAFEYTVPVPSAQVKSALLLAGLFTDGLVVEPVETRDHTERLLLFMDADIRIKNTTRGKEIYITGKKDLSPVELAVPGDISSAIFFIAAALILPGSDVRIQNVLLNRTRSHIIDLLRMMGGRIDVEIEREYPEPVGSVRARYSKLQGISVSGTNIPLIIDEIPALAVVACHAGGKTEVRGASELRVKESDRIRGIVELVRSFGGDIQERDDGFVVTGGGFYAPGSVRSFGDHRIAMAAGIFALSVKGKTAIDDDACIDISYPGFFEDLKTLTGTRSRAGKVP